ncbi:hypothetical protein [Streptomyces sp. NPDC091416]|uniref:hypothetical protein n=1 Tax=Streptomyces sp. NPDC091416 TaxID=3366003 RepID=UPI00382D2156
MNRDYLKWAALACALVATASAEYELARAVGYNQWVAAAVPGALDVWTVRAMRQHRDVLAAVVAMILVNAASHLVTAGLLSVSVSLVVGVSAIAPLVLYRLHTITGTGQETEQPAAAEAPDTEPVPVVPAPQRYGDPVVVRPVPKVVPEGVALLPVVAAPVLGEQQSVYPVSTAVPVHTPAPVELPAADAAPGLERQVICGAHRVFTLTVPPVPDPPKVNTRLSAEQAREVIEAGWVNGAGVRETARLSTRSASYVAKVFTQLTEAQAAAAAPVSLALVAEEVSA